MRRWILPLLLAGALLALILMVATGVYGRTGRLNGAQHAFSVAFSQLILFAQDLGYTVSIGECYRPERLGSLHALRLACDLHLFKDRRYLRGTEDYRHLGAWWIRYGHNYGIPLEWGGSGDRADGNHFSHGWNGRW